MEFILLQLLWGGRKIAQIGQTEPTKPIFGALLGYPKAYDGTSRGEVCSKHMALYNRNSSNDELFLYFNIFSCNKMALLNVSFALCGVSILLHLHSYSSGFVSSLIS